VRAGKLAVLGIVVVAAGAPEAFRGGLPSAVVDRSRTVRRRPTASERRDLRVLLALGTVRVYVSAVDASLNTRTRELAVSAV